MEKETRLTLAVCSYLKRRGASTREALWILAGALATMVHVTQEDPETVFAQIRELLGALRQRG